VTVSIVKGGAITMGGFGISKFTVIRNDLRQGGTVCGKLSVHTPYGIVRDVVFLASVGRAGGSCLPA
jgi:hypothetical protein